MLLTDEERKKMESLSDGSYYGQIGITIRFGNHFWFEQSGSLLAGACGGDNLPTLIQVRKRKNVPRGTDVGKKGINRGTVMGFDSKLNQTIYEEVSSTICLSNYKEPPAIIKRIGKKHDN